MYSTVISASIYGVESRIVRVEADVSEGLPSFAMVGYLSTQVKEAQERVRTALKNSGIYLTPKKIAVNLAPADLKKSGTGFDLPIAVAIAAAYGFIGKEVLKETFIVGELGLNGAVNPVPGIYAMISELKEQGCVRCIVPRENVREAKEAGQVEVIGVSSLQEAVYYLQTGTYEEVSYEEEDEIGKAKKYKVDFADIQGQEVIKRTAVIAAAGFHNLLMVGPPGAGKSMIAKRIPTILPEMTREEQKEVSKVYSVLGMLKGERKTITERPFRAPHHTISPQALVGGGMLPRPGEVSMAHNGVLFLDELPEFSRETLEVLRQPLEEGKIEISRTAGVCSFPSNIMLVAAMNPCPCGYFPDMNRCHCTHGAIAKYNNKISGPLLDRMDLTVRVNPVSYEDLQENGTILSSEQMRKQVEKAREIQQARYDGTTLRFNSDLSSTDMEKYCLLKKEEKDLMKQAFEKLQLSARSYHRILKVSRTIADLNGSEEICQEHIHEALCLRMR